MSSGADLFVVCKQCGSEVSPYITECPYCGHRLRRRAPKLPKPGQPLPRAPRASLPILGRLRRSGTVTSRRQHPPLVTGALVIAACVVWVLAHARPLTELELSLTIPLGGHWWRLLTSLFVYFNGWFAFLALATVALYGWLLERRHGPFVVLALFFGAGLTGALAVAATHEFALVAGGNAGAIALLAAWAVPDLQAARAQRYYEGDLLGTAAIAAALLAIPFAIYGASPLAGVCGALIGLVLGYGLSRTRAAGLS